jgi:hypothetical protein
MDLLFPDQGLVYQINKILSAGVNYHLFANSIVPTLSTTLAGLTEAAWAGYGGPIAQTWADFVINGVSSHSGFAIAAPISFGNTSGVSQNAYGYYITDSANSLLVGVALFDSPPIVIPSGGTCVVVPVYGDFSQLSA